MTIQSTTPDPYVAALEASLLIDPVAFVACCARKLVRGEDLPPAVIAWLAQITTEAREYLLTTGLPATERQVLRADAQTFLEQVAYPAPAVNPEPLPVAALLWRPTVDYFAYAKREARAAFDRRQAERDADPLYASLDRACREAREARVKDFPTLLTEKDVPHGR